MATMSQTVLDPRLPSPSDRPTAEQLFRLGMRYATGIGAPVDMVCAYALFDVAARFGSLEAKIYRRELREEMDPLDVAESQSLARTWLIAAEVIAQGA
jgi:TPR repeat protein